MPRKPGCAWASSYIAPDISEVAIIRVRALHSDHGHVVGRLGSLRNGHTDHRRRHPLAVVGADLHVGVSAGGRGLPLHTLANGTLRARRLLTRWFGFRG